LYNGKTVKLAINRKVIVGDVKECDKCNGQGATMEMRQIGPGMITQVQRPCGDCGGQGNTAETKAERKVLEVHIDKGSKNNQRITFRGMADEIPNMETGDINFIVQEKEHELFKRKGADLLVTKDLSLKQALCGFTVRLHLFAVCDYCILFLNTIYSLYYSVSPTLFIVEDYSFGWSRGCHQDSSGRNHSGRAKGR
jgi:DnaJ family protein A protein 2